MCLAVCVCHLFQTSLSQFPVSEMVVRRRYSDFHWLHERLCVVFPGVLIPRFPEKKMVGNRDSAFLEDRRKALEIYVVRSTAPCCQMTRVYDTTSLPCFLDGPFAEQNRSPLTVGDQHGLGCVPWGIAGGTVECGACGSQSCWSESNGVALTFLGATGMPLLRELQALAAAKDVVARMQARLSDGDSMLKYITDLVRVISVDADVDTSVGGDVDGVVDVMAMQGSRGGLVIKSDEVFMEHCARSSAALAQLTNSVIRSTAVMAARKGKRWCGVVAAYWRCRRCVSACSLTAVACS